MKLKLFLKVILLLLLAPALFITSCKVEKIAPQSESTKDISGSWKVIRATRNGTDITSIIDFSQFRVKFDSQGNYTLVNSLPFLVTANGKYALDDPQYPFKITFTPTGGSTVSTAFNYPIVAGSRQLNMTFSPGCPQNTYVYTLVKE